MNMPYKKKLKKNNLQGLTWDTFIRKIFPCKYKKNFL